MPHATRLAAELKKARSDADVKLIEGGRGDFIVIADGQECWNKRGGDGRFPNPGEVLERLSH